MARKNAIRWETTRTTRFGAGGAAFGSKGAPVRPDRPGGVVRRGPPSAHTSPPAQILLVCARRISSPRFELLSVIS